jgi:tetratricopeptide (TPR) repeat protein
VIILFSFMITKEMSKVEIENFLTGKGDYVQIDHLTRFLADKQVPTDKRKFVHTKLAEIYERRGMFAEAAKMYNNVAIASVVFGDKIKAYTQEAKFYIKAGMFELADEAIKKAIGEANSSERINLQANIKIFYKQQAEIYEKQNRRSNAVKIYEKMLQMRLFEPDRPMIKEKLLGLYEKIGKIKEYLALKGGK